MEINAITRIVIEESIEIHKELGPGLLESVYELVLAKRLMDRGLRVKRQQMVPITYKGEVFPEAFRLDLLVEDLVVVELKSMERLAPVHFKQTKTHLRLLGKQVALLINFGETTLVEGLHRIVNGYDGPSPGDWPSLH